MMKHHPALGAAVAHPGKRCNWSGPGLGQRRSRQKGCRNRRMSAFGSHRCARALRALATLLVVSAPLGGCFTQTYQRGYVLADGALDQIPLGATQEQVLIVLGTPSTVATVSGEVFYYISQRTEQTAFMPQRVVDQRVI